MNSLSVRKINPPCKLRSMGAVTISLRLRSYLPYEQGIHVSFEMKKSDPTRTPICIRDARGSGFEPISLQIFTAAVGAQVASNR